MEFNEKELGEIQKAVKDAFDKQAENLKTVQDELRESTTEGKKLKEAVTALQQNYDAGKKGMEVLDSKIAENIKKWSEVAKEMQEKLAAMSREVLDLQQSGTKGLGGPEEKTVYEMIVESENYKRCNGDPEARRMDPVRIGSFHKRLANPGERKTQIVNAAGQNQPLVPSQRVPGIITPAEQRLFIRDVIPAARTASNLIEYVVEASFTNNAAPQGDTSPVGTGEGETKQESAMTFTLTPSPVRTIAHWIPASRQVLQDATMLEAHISQRLIYGLKLEEEQEILTGTATGNTLNGINNQAAAFAFGVTNATLLDTLLDGFLQVSLSNYEASALVLHPTDWNSIQKLKDSQNRYLFVDPAMMTTPQVWGKPVVASQSQTLGYFTTGAFSLGAQIWDKEDASVRMSDSHASFFVQNMVAILCEERLALCVYRPAAFVYGVLSHAG